MVKKRGPMVRVLGALGAAALTLTAVLQLSSASAATFTGTVRVNPSSQVVASGAVVSVKLTQNANNLTKGAQATVQFDQQILQLVRQCTITTSPVLQGALAASPAGTQEVANIDNLNRFNGGQFPCLATLGTEVVVVKAYTGDGPAGVQDTATIVRGASGTTTTTHAVSDPFTTGPAPIAKGAPYSTAGLLVGVAPQSVDQAIIAANSTGTLTNVATFYDETGPTVALGDADVVKLQFVGIADGLSPITLSNVELTGAALAGASVRGLAVDGWVRVGGGGATPQPISVSPATQFVNLGDTVSVTVHQNAASATKGIQTDVSYDKDLLTMVRTCTITTSPLLQQAMAASASNAHEVVNIDNLNRFSGGEFPCSAKIGTEDVVATAYSGDGPAGAQDTVSLVRGAFGGATTTHNSGDAIVGGGVAPMLRGSAYLPGSSALEFGVFPQTITDALVTANSTGTLHNLAAFYDNGAAESVAAGDKESLVLHFMAKTNGLSPITLSTALLSDTSGPIPVLATNGFVGVGTDVDGDGCSNVKEQGLNHAQGGQRDPLTFWDFFDVPAPAGPATGGDGKLILTPSSVRNKAVTLQDVSVVLAYVGRTSTNPAYIADNNGDGISDGQQLDRTPSTVVGEPWHSGPPSNAITLQDVSVALAQVGNNCP